MYVRETQLINVTIQTQNTLQPIEGLAVLVTVADIIRTQDGQQVGYPHQRQQFMIPSDITPELLETLNRSLASIGHKLVPIEGSDE